MIISLIMLILGIGLEIVKTNNILIIQNWIIYICFGVSAIAFLGSVINYFSVNRKVLKNF